MPLRTIAIAAALAAAMSLSGCAGMLENAGSTKLPVQYATLKVIEDSDSITGQDVVERVEELRTLVEDNATISIDRLVAEVRGPIDFDALAPSDRLLVEALISQIEYAARDIDLVGEARQVKLLTLLDWVEQAAGYAY